MTGRPNPARPATLLAILLSGLVGACGTSSGSGDPAKPATPEREDIYRYGSILGGEGGLAILGGPNRRDKDTDNTGIGVNGFLWRASLDTLSFMPIVSADPFGGVILTDWYSPPDTPNERFKVNLYILDKQLRADGVRVSVFRQTRSGAGWQDAGVAADTAGTLEEAVLTRARQLRIAQTAAR